jgi:hypothetical protein
MDAPAATNGVGDCGTASSPVLHTAGELTAEAAASRPARAPAIGNFGIHNEEDEEADSDASWTRASTGRGRPRPAPSLPPVATANVFDVLRDTPDGWCEKLEDRVEYLVGFPPLVLRFSIGKCRNCPFFRAL